MSDYKLPVCWLGKSITEVQPDGTMIGVEVTPLMINPKCHCFNEAAAFFCMEGHLTECHAGKTCEEANCSHYQKEQDVEGGNGNVV